MADEEADLVSATGEQAFTTNLDYSLIPILGEGLPGRENLANYYSVAVVNAVSSSRCGSGHQPVLPERFLRGADCCAALCQEFCEGNNKTFADLRGLDSCHTGYQRTVSYVFRLWLTERTCHSSICLLQAGWDFPVGALLSTGVMSRVSELPSVEDDAESIAAFFDDVCAPRGNTLTINAPVVRSNGTGGQWEELCDACEVHFCVLLPLMLCMDSALQNCTSPVISVCVHTQHVVSCRVHLLLNAYCATNSSVHQLLTKHCSVASCLLGHASCVMPAVQSP